MADHTRLDAVAWLGRGIDMTSLTPFSMESVKKWIKLPRIVAVQKDQKDHVVTIGGVEYTIPSIVSASEDTGGSQISDLTYRSGDAALQGFASDPGASNGLAVVAPDTSSYPLKKSLPIGYQFAFYTLSSDAYSASLREYFDFIDNKMLWSKISKLPQPFTNESEVLDAYTTFFGEIGTHVITSATYGARCNISTWASNKYSDVNANWKRDVTASVHGINGGGNFDSAVFEEPQYQVFKTIAQTLITIIGGDKALAESLMQGNYNYEHFDQWLGTTLSAPVLVSVGVTELWTLLRDSDNSKIRDSADAIEAAFHAIVDNYDKQKVTTLAILEGKSDIAELDLLSPSAVVGVGGPLPAFDPATQRIIGLSETKVRMGDPGQEQENRIVPFYIINDGSPIDISLRRNSGEAKVTINGISYSNKEKNVGIFHQVPILEVGKDAVV